MISPSWTRTAAVANSPATLSATVGSSGHRALRSSGDLHVGRSSHLDPEPVQILQLFVEPLAESDVSGSRVH